MTNVQHTECIYRALAMMSTNYADTLREVRLGLTDVKMEDMTVPTFEAATEWAMEFGTCTCDDDKDNYPGTCIGCNGAEIMNGHRRECPDAV